MTCQRTSTGRTCSTSSIHREAIHAHGHKGSNQKSTTVGSCWAMALLLGGYRAPPMPRAGGTAASLGARGVNRAGRTGIPPGPWEDAGTAEPGRTRDSRARKDQQLASNLTRDEAGDRARLLDVGSYRVELDLTGGETTFTSVSTVRFRCARPGATTFIDLT